MGPIGYSGVHGKIIHEKIQKSKISCQTPFKARTTDYCHMENILTRRTV
jgi:hypothetical protein